MDISTKMFTYTHTVSISRITINTNMYQELHKSKTIMNTTKFTALIRLTMKSNKIFVIHRHKHTCKKENEYPSLTNFLALATN